jgi:hypothetical protein
MTIQVDPGTRQPKGKLRKKRLRADRRPLMTSGTVDERYLWLQAGGR